MEKKPTEHVIRLSGKATLLGELSLGESYKIELDGAVDQMLDEDEQDGNVTRYYRFRPITAKILAENGKVTATKDARKRSQQMRAVLRREWESLGKNITEEDYYDGEMADIIRRRINGEI